MTKDDLAALPGALRTLANKQAHQADANLIMRAVRALEELSAVEPITQSSKIEQLEREIEKWKGMWAGTQRLVRQAAGTDENPWDVILIKCRRADEPTAQCQHGNKPENCIYQECNTEKSADKHCKTCGCAPCRCGHTTDCTLYGMHASCPACHPEKSAADHIHTFADLRPDAPCQFAGCGVTRRQLRSLNRDAI